MFGIFAALAELKREPIRQRTPGPTRGRAGVRATGLSHVESAGAAGPGRT